MTPTGAGRSIVVAVVLVLAIAGVGLAGTSRAEAIGPNRLPVDLGALGSNPAQLSSSASGINNGGDIVGWSQRSVNDAGHAYWRDTSGQKHDLGTLGGSDSFASDINESRQVVGYAHKTLAIDSPWHAFSWSAGRGMVDLRTLPGGTDSFAEGVNDVGQVVGRSNTATFDWHAFVWTAAGGMVDLHTLGGDSSFAYGINNAGQVVGESEIPSGAWHAFVWDAAHGMVDLSTLGGQDSEARAINEAGQIVGVSDTADGESHAFMWDSVHGMIDLQTLGGERSLAFGINEAGRVTGAADTADGRSHAFTWDAEEGMVDLHTLGGLTAAALDINDEGAIAGSSSLASGVTHAALWPPKVTLTTPAEGASFKQRRPVLADYSCAAVVSCVGSVPVGAPIDTATLGPHTFVVSGVDGDGTVHVVTHHYDVVADTTPPTVAISSPGEGSVLAVGDVRSAFYTCSDEPDGSGVASCTGTVPNGGLLDATEGPHSLTFTATDNAGNTSTATRHYVVVGQTISVGSASVVEGDIGKPRSLRFPVTLSRPASNLQTVDWSVDVSGGSASPDDVIVKSGTVKFQPSARTGLTATVKFATVRISPDMDVEGDETFSVRLSNPSGGFTVATPATVGTILDDDPGAGLHVDVGDAAIVEGSWGTGNAAKLSVTLSAPATTTVSVQVSVGDGTASAGGKDYKAFKTKTITFRPGQWQKSVGVKILTDAAPEADETVVVTISSPSAGLTLGRSAGTVTVLDDD